MQAPMVLIVHVLLSCFILAVQIDTYGISFIAFISASVIVWSYLGGLYASLIVYRLSPFHRLNRFPGPRLAAVSKLWHVWQCRDSRNHQLMERLHNQYGDFVRIGMYPFYIQARDSLNWSF